MRSSLVVSPAWLRSAIFSLVLGPFFGCSLWTVPEAATAVPQLPRPQMSKDSVGLEIATVSLAYDRGAEFSQILHELDQQILPAKVRQRLAQNGFCVGSFDTQLPAPIRLLLMEAGDRRQHPTAETYHAEQDRQRFIQCRSGKRYTVPLWAHEEDLVFEHFDGETVVRDEYSQPRCQVVITGAGEGDAAEVELVPEIEHGKLKQAFVSSGNSFHLEAQRDRRTLEDLRMRFRLRPGETVMITSTPEQEGLAQQFFRNGRRTRQKAVLIRLAQTQLGDLYPQADQEQLTSHLD